MSHHEYRTRTIADSVHGRTAAQATPCGPRPGRRSTPLRSLPLIFMYYCAGFLGVFAAAITSRPAFAQTPPDVNVVITADNAYGFGYGNITGITNYFGAVENCTAGAIFNCVGGPETYLVPGSATVGGYLYIVAWSDDSASQGVIAKFQEVGNPVAILTGQGDWEVFATGIDEEVCDGAPAGPPLNGSPSAINSQIALANSNAGPNPGSSIGWVGLGGTTGTLGALAFGEDNSSSGGSFQLVCNPPMDAAANWMWYNRDPATLTNPFDDDVSPAGPGGHKEYLIFRRRFGCTRPPSGMVAWWTLDEQAGLNSKDSAGDNDGTHVNGFVPVAGMVDGAALFGGATNNYVEAPNHASLNFGASPAGDFSIDAWIRTNANTGVRPIVDKRTTSTPPGLFGYMLFLFNGNLALQLADNGPSGGSFNYISTTLVADGLWHHVAVTVDRDQPTGGTFYVDGQALPQTFNPLGRTLSLVNTAPLRIGAHSTGSSYFDGEIDEVEIFDRVLTALEVQDIYSAKDAGKCKCEPLPDGSACTNFCPSQHGVSCQPTEVTCRGELCRITDCDCLFANECHAEFPLPASGLRCNGTCPVEETCLERTVELPEGFTVHQCDCAPCELLPEACCVDGDCIMQDPQCCLARGGSPQGAGSACTTPEACCFRGGGCEMLDPLCCLNVGGSPGGAGTSCQGIRACCSPDGSCGNADAQCCAAPLAPGTACEGDTNNDGIDDACCDESPAGEVILDLTTGLNSSGGLLPINAADHTWAVTCAPTTAGTLPRPAVVVTPSTAWLTIPGTQWISGDPATPAAVGDYCYRTCFCLKDGFQDASLSFSLRADNLATVFLNGSQLVVTPGPSFNTPTPTTFMTANQALFRPGENCIEVRVFNASGPTGFNMTGQVTANDAQCCCEPAAEGLACTPKTCPDERERCVPTLAHYDPCTGDALAKDCACRQPNRCRLMLTPDGPKCMGGCTPLQRCTLHKRDTNGDTIPDEYVCSCDGVHAEEIADIDNDGDVDLIDHALMQNLFTGPRE